MVVDAHAHVIVPGLGADVAWRDGGQVVTFGGRELVRGLELPAEQEAAILGGNTLRLLGQEIPA